MRSYTFNLAPDGRTAPDYVKNWERFDVPHGATSIFSDNGDFETDPDTEYAGVLRPDTPQAVVIDGAAHLNFYTYQYRKNAPHPFLGAEIRTKAHFDPPALNTYIDFTATVALPYSKSGLIFGFYTYSANDVIPVQQEQGDELDIELLGKPIYNGKPVGPPKGLWLNTFNNQNKDRDNRVSLQNENVDPATSITYPAYIQSGQNTYTIRWFHNHAGFGVKWFVHEILHEGPDVNKMILVRTEPTGRYIKHSRDAMPDQAMKIHFNIWAPGWSKTSSFLPGDIFPQALDTNLKPAKSAKNARKFTFDVFKVVVQRGKIIAKSNP